MAPRDPGEERDGVRLTNLDDQLFAADQFPSNRFAGLGVTKRALVDYLDGVGERILRELRDRPLSVIRVTHGQAPFMQKNLPRHAPDFVARVPVWAEASQRTVNYALCNDRPTLLWFANQRAVEYHPSLLRIDSGGRATHLVLDLDPPEGASFAAVVRAAAAVRIALTDSGLTGAVKTSGAKGLHVVVPIEGTVIDDAAAATRALAARVGRVDPQATTTAFVKADREGKVFVDPTRVGGATLACAYSPRARPGVPVSFPVAWDDLAEVDPRAFTIMNALDLLGDRDPWAESLPAPQVLPPDLVAEGHTIAIPRVAAMHEGRRRAAQARRDPTG